MPDITLSEADVNDLRAVIEDLLVAVHAARRTIEEGAPTPVATARLAISLQEREKLGAKLLGYPSFGHLLAKVKLERMNAGEA